MRSTVKASQINNLGISSTIVYVTERSDNYVLYGKVTDGTNPLKDAVVSVSDMASPDVVYSMAVTGEDGSYSLMVPESTYNKVHIILSVQKTVSDQQKLIPSQLRMVRNWI